MERLENSKPAHIAIEEAVRLGAEDAAFFGEFFFPNTCRMTTPPFHLDMDELLDSPDNRYVSFKVFRGGAKTSKVRLYMAKRISYGLSRTIVVVGKSQEHAVKTVEWLQRQVETNRKWNNTFQVRKGKKWTPSELEISQLLAGDEHPVTVRVIAIGITGSSRGINVDDHRPDLIIVDDPQDEENTNTPEQRKKIADLFFGALEKSLAPRSEAPHAKMVLLQTVLNAEDLISLTMKDATWKSLDISVFDDNGESRWPERWTTEELKAAKQAHVDRYQLPLWLREMEGKTSSEETATFAPVSLQYFENAPEEGVIILCIDPVPPPDAGRDGIVKITQRHDDFVIMALQLCKGHVYLLEYWAEKRPDEERALSEIIAFILRYKPYHIAFESVLFQRVLKRALERRLEKAKLYYPVLAVEDKRPKPQRIRQEVGNYASYRKLHVRKDQTKFLEQFIRYPDVTHDDILDCLAIGLMTVEPWMFELNVIEGEYEVVDEDATDPAALAWDGAP